MRLVQLMLTYSRSTVLIAALMGLLSGLSNAAVLGILNTAIRTFPEMPTALPGAFLGCGLVLFVSATLAQWLLAKLTQQIVYRLLLQLTQQILESPFQRLEQVGAPKLMAVLTNDVEVISGASSLLSGLSVYVALLLGCLGYLCWLSPSLFLFFTGFLTVAMYLYFPE
jgi:putative ATP-binding cassette transporter